MNGSDLYIIRGDELEGPFGLLDLVRRAKKGSLLATDMIKEGRFGDAAMASEIAELSDIFNPTAIDANVETTSDIVLDTMIEYAKDVVSGYKSLHLYASIVLLFTIFFVILVTTNIAESAIMVCAPFCFFLGYWLLSVIVYSKIQGVSTSAELSSVISRNISNGCLMCLSLGIVVGILPLITYTQDQVVAWAILILISISALPFVLFSPLICMHDNANAFAALLSSARMVTDRKGLGTAFTGSILLNLSSVTILGYIFVLPYIVGGVTQYFYEHPYK